MPSVMTLEGPLGKKAQDMPQLFGEFGDSMLIDWMHQQNPIVAGAVALGLSLVVGLTVSHAMVWGFERLKTMAKR